MHVYPNDNCNRIDIALLHIMSYRHIAFTTRVLLDQVRVFFSLEDSRRRNGYILCGRGVRLASYRNISFHMSHTVPL